MLVRLREIFGFRDPPAPMRDPRKSQNINDVPYVNVTLADGNISISRVSERFEGDIETFS